MYNNQAAEMDLRQLFLMIKKKIVIILSTLLLCGGTAFFITSFLLPKEYEATAKMVVSVQSNNDSDITSDQISSAKSLVDAYAIVIKSRAVLSLVIGDLNLEMSYEDLYDCVSVVAVNNTQIMELSVQSNDPDGAIAILNDILSISPAIIEDSMGSCLLNTLENAYCSGEPVSPRVGTITALSALLGGILTICFLAIRSMQHYTEQNHTSEETINRKGRRERKRI